MTPLLTPTPKFHQFIAQYDTWNFGEETPKYNNKQRVSIKTIILNHNND